MPASAAAPPPPPPPGGGGGRGPTPSGGGKRKNCVVKHLSTACIVFILTVLMGGTLTRIPHPENPGELLPVRQVLDFVYQGNIFPDGQRRRANDTALHIRGHAKLAIEEMERNGDNVRARDLWPLLGMTGDKLQEGFGMRWFYTDRDHQQKGRPSTVVQRVPPGTNPGPSGDRQTRPYGRFDGYWMRISSALGNAVNRATGGGKRTMSPRSEAVARASADAQGRGVPPPSAPTQEFVEAANGMVVNADNFHVAANMITQRRVDEYTAALRAAAEEHVSPSEQGNTTMQHYALGIQNQNRRGSRGPYRSSHQSRSLNNMYADDSEGGGGGGGGGREGGRGGGRREQPRGGGGSTGKQRKYGSDDEEEEEDYDEYYDGYDELDGGEGGGWGDDGRDDDDDYDDEAGSRGWGGRHGRRRSQYGEEEEEEEEEEGGGGGGRRSSVGSRRGRSGSEGGGSESGASQGKSRWPGDDGTVVPVCVRGGEWV